ncbi:MAG: hypothetical protein FWG66_05530 [Spirochaetes bacterium]|nr:hypothetical protein [Spirochaetota bacterium]
MKNTKVMTATRRATIALDLMFLAIFRIAAVNINTVFLLLLARRGEIFPLLHSTINSQRKASKLQLNLRNFPAKFRKGCALAKISGN